MSMSRRNSSAIMRKVLVSDQAGRSNLLAELDVSASTVASDDPRSTRCSEVKEREAVGYAYEGADASFFLLAQAHARRGAGVYFTVERFHVNVERRYNAVGELVASPRPW
jgi:2-isopropylmalate synthase